MRNSTLAGFMVVVYGSAVVAAIARGFPVVALFGVIGGLYCLVWFVRYRDLERWSRESGERVRHPSGRGAGSS